MPAPSRIKAICAERGITIGELADRIGHNRNVIYAVSSGYRKAWPRLRRQLADELGEPESMLFPAEPRARSA